MAGIGGCPNVGGICIGCTMPGFPDKFMPFMDEPPGANEVTDDISAKDREEIHRRIRQEVLDTESSPEIVYECSKVTGSGGGDRYWVALKGELTMRGITRPSPVSARVSLNGNSLRASGDFTLRQSDFRIPPSRLRRERSA